MNSIPIGPVLTEDEIVACLVKAGCIGTIKMSYETGPYDITRPSLNATKFVRAIEEALNKSTELLESS